MYYVNVEQIEQRLAVIPVLQEACEELMWEAAKYRSGEAAIAAANLPVLLRLAQERALHLAIELVTDVGSLLIDGFLLRDASSYEDIIEILRVEDVFPGWLVAPLQELVRLRKRLVQEYMAEDMTGIHPLTEWLPSLLPEFEASVRGFMAKEWGMSS